MSSEKESDEDSEEEKPAKKKSRKSEVDVSGPKVDAVTLRKKVLAVNKSLMAALTALMALENFLE